MISKEMLENYQTYKNWMRFFSLLKRASYEEIKRGMKK